MKSTTTQTLILVATTLALALLVANIALATKRDDLIVNPNGPHEDRQIEGLFRQFIERFNKQYSIHEVTDRFNNFKRNLARINELNKMNNGATYGITPFADMSEEEFREKMLIGPSAPVADPEDRYAKDLPTDNLPDSWDWREKGAVTPVKNQGTVGTCWAFSTTGNIEGQWFLAHNELLTLSEEQLVDCDYHDCGVFGGWPYLAMEYIMAAGGIETEESFPYCCTGENPCFPCMPNKNTTFCGPPPAYCNRTCTADPSKFAAKVENWTRISTDEDQIAAQLVSRGPLSVLLNAETLFLYHKGIYNPHFCNPENLDHAVLLVGYGSEKNTFGKEQPYWIVKNSWGTDWGEDGYFRIARGTGKCGINTWVISAIVP